MKANKLQNILSVLLALIMIAGAFTLISVPAKAAETYERGFNSMIMVEHPLLAAPTSAAEEKIYDFFDLEPAIMKFEESASGSDCDFVSVAEAYGTCGYYLDMAYLLKDFDVDEFLKQNENGYIFMYVKPESDFTVRYSTNDFDYFSDEIPKKVVYGQDRFEDDMYYYVDHYRLCAFGRGTEKKYYDETCTLGNIAIYLRARWDSGHRPITMTLKVTSDEDHQQVAYKKVIKIDMYSGVGSIKTVDIYDFEFPGKHGAVMDTDAWSNMGNVISIKYLDENKKNERTKLMAGDTGYVEFTVVMLKNSYVDFYGGGEHTTPKARWHNDVKSKLKSSVSGIDTSSAEHVITTENPYVCKFYHHYEIADNETYVIKQGTINLTAPKADKKPDSTVKTSNVGFVPSRRPVIGTQTKPTPQFTASDAIWLTMGRNNQLTAVSSFAAGKTYFALVKLNPHGNYYFNSESVKNLKVPGASSFTITYQKAGTNTYIKEDGWYLLATFPKVTANYYDIAINYDKPEITAPQDSSSYLSALCGADLSSATDLKVQWYFSNDITKDSVGELCASSDGDLKLQVDTSTIGTGYYKCFITCKINGLASRMQYPSSEWVKVTITEKAPDPLSLRAVGKQSVPITEKGQTVTFEVTAKNTSGTVNYTWFECDASGKKPDDVAIGTESKLVLTGLDGGYGDMFYFICVARDSKGTDSLLFTATVLYDDEIQPPQTSAPETNPPVTTPADTTPGDTSNGNTSPTDTSNASGSESTGTSAPSESGEGTSGNGTSETDPTAPSKAPDHGILPWLIIAIVLVLAAIVIVVIVIVRKKKKSN